MTFGDSLMLKLRTICGALATWLPHLATENAQLPPPLKQGTGELGKAPERICQVPPIAVVQLMQQVPLQLPQQLLAAVLHACHGPGQLRCIQWAQSLAPPGNLGGQLLEQMLAVR